MKLNKGTSSLVAEIEYLIGAECYNSRSYGNGCSFRYPVTLRYSSQRTRSKRELIKNVSFGCSFTAHDDFISYSGNVSLNQIFEGIMPNDVLDMQYRFGANQLHIGKGIVKVLEYLEKRYNLNFNELERERRKNNKEK